ncbi:MAG: hypothetical protein HQK49_22485 [Oligoflexia bacterium]|nr:hypothetical protein [Oligoflexia bacterium]
MMIVNWENNFKRFKRYLNHAFYISNGRADLTEDDFKFLDKCAEIIVKRGLATPAIMFLENLKPLNFIGSSVITFFKPMIGNFFKSFDYERLEKLLEKRCVVEVLVERIELKENYSNNNSK